MTYLSIIEKFKILFESLFDFKFIFIFLMLLILLTFLFLVKKLSVKKYTLFMIISFIIVFSISIVSNYNVLSKTFDDFTTIFFGNIYFPSIYVYIGVLVVSFLSFIITLLNKMIYKVYKVLNTIMFVVNNFLFVIVINIISKNKIDIFSVNSLYTNTELVVVLELSMGLCVLWILSLMAAYITNVISERLAYKKSNSYNEQIKEVEVFNPLLEVNIDFDKSSEKVNVKRKNPLLIEQISNGKELINSKIIEEEEKFIFDNDKLVESEVVENITDINNGIVMENTTEAVNNLLGSESIEINNILGELIIQDNCGNSDISNDNVVIETADNHNEDITNEGNMLTFNDILNGCIKVNYYDNNIIEDEYTLYDPQKVYEEKYNKAKCEIETSANISINNLIEEISDDGFDDNISLDEEYKENFNNDDKHNIINKKLYNNTISLNDLIDVEEIDIYENKNSDIENRNDYTVEDYKKMAEMLNSVRTYANNSNINIDDAVAISLIKNYSIDECLKFKNILENNLN